MAEIMGAFAHDLDNFVAYYEKQQWDTSFRGEQYPPRIVMEQSTPPLFEVGADGAKTLVPNPTIIPCCLKTRRSSCAAPGIGGAGMISSVSTAARSAAGRRSHISKSGKMEA